MILRRQLPRIVQAGVAQTLDWDIYSDAGVQQTPTAATVSIYLGSEALVEDGDVTEAAPSTYALAASVTTGRDPADDYLEILSATIGGQDYTFRVSGYLVRHAYVPSITDTDLTDRHTELANFSTKLGGYQTHRDEANRDLQLDLLQRGRRPWLIFDVYDARRLHIYKTLFHIFNDFTSVVGDGKYERLRDQYARLYAEGLESMNFRYDTNETGTIDDTDRDPASGPIVVTAGRPRGGAYRRWGY